MKFKGLTIEEVNGRINNNLVNTYNKSLSKTKKIIIFENVFSLFNIINFILGFMIFITGEYKNLLFLGVVFCNTFISLYQSLKAKKIIESLSIINNRTVKVIRDNSVNVIDINKIVLDDLIKYNLGNQVVVDSKIVDGSVLVDESFITGESDYIRKSKDDVLLSGSFIVSGECIGKVISIGEDNYANKITKEAVYHKKVNSEIMNTLNKIIKFVSISIVPLGLLLFYKQYLLNDGNIDISLINTVAALIGTIPEGLVLLTSTVFAVSSIRLSNKKVLVQDLYCIESLARIDTICLDKTGTLTTGNMKIKEVITLDKKYDVNLILSNIITHMINDNSTSRCLINSFSKDNSYNFVNKIDFSSLTKSSIYEFKEGTFILGAYEFINWKTKINFTKYSQYRSLVLGVNDDKIVNNKVTNSFNIIGIILIEDEIRDNVLQVLDYFRKEDIRVKIISGDNVFAIKSILNKIGLNDMKVFDMSDSKKPIEDVVEKYDIFGRVTPSLKREIIRALKKNNHKVAFAGDGVNDVLSLKEANSSITFACGCDAAKSVSELILLDDDFKGIPSIIKEGRRSINNLERSSSLFLTKTIYALVFAFLFLFINVKYPFIPIQLTLISTLTIGIPSFLLALEPNTNRVKNNFLFNVIVKSIPSAITIVLNVVSIIVISQIFKYDYNVVSTMDVILVAFVEFVLLFKVCYPFNWMRKILYILLLVIFVGSALCFNNIFELCTLNFRQIMIINSMALIDIFMVKILTFIIKRGKKYE